MCLENNHTRLRVLVPTTQYPKHITVEWKVFLQLAECKGVVTHSPGQGKLGPVVIFNRVDK